MLESAHRRNLLSKTIEDVKSNNPQIKKLLDKKRKLQTAKRFEPAIKFVICVWFLFAILAHGHSIFPFIVLQDFLPDSLISFASYLCVFFLKIPILETVDPHYQNLISLHFGIGAILIGLAFFVAQEISKESDKSNELNSLVGVRDSIVKESRFLELLLAEVLVSFLFLHGSVNIFILMPVALVGLSTLYYTYKTINFLLNDRSGKDFFLRSLKADFYQIIESEIEKHIGTEKIHEEFKIGKGGIVATLFAPDEEYVGIKSQKSGVFTDLDIGKIKKITRIVSPHRETTKNRFLTTNDEKSELKVYCYLQALFHASFSEGSPLLWVHRDLIDENKKSKIEKQVNQAFTISAENNNSKSSQNCITKLKRISLNLIKNQNGEELYEALESYEEIIKLFYEDLEAYRFIFPEQQDALAFLFSEMNSPIYQISEDIKEILEMGIKSPNKAIPQEIIRIPSRLMRHAINNKDFLIFKYFQNHFYNLYRYSRNPENRENATFLFDRSWRHLKEIVAYDLSMKIKDSEYPIEQINKFACAILLIFQNLLKISFDERDFDAFTKYLSVTTKLFKGIERAMRHDNIDRTKGLVDSLKQKNQEVIFGLSSWILGKWRENREAGDIERFYSAIQKETPSEIERLTDLFSRCHHFETIGFHGWDNWEAEGKEEGEVHSIDSFEKLEVFYAVRSLSLLANKTSKEIEEINLPHSRTLEALARGVRRLMPTLDSIKANPSEWNFALTDAAIEKIDSFKNLLSKAKEAQEQEDAETIRKRAISPNLVNKFKEKAKETFSESAIMRDIFTKCFKSYEYQTERDIAESDGWFGIKELIGKDIFLADWHVDGSLVRDEFGRSMAQGENNLLFKEIVNNCREIARDDFESTLAAFENAENVVMLATQNSFWNFFAESKNFKANWTGEIEPLDVKGFEGWYVLNGRKIPVFEIHCATSGEPILILDKTKVGKIVQLSPLLKNGNQDCVGGIFYMDIRAFSHDEKLMEQLIAESPSWLQEISQDAEAQSEYLCGRVLIEIFERFQYEASKDFEGYILFTQSDNASLLNA